MPDPTSRPVVQPSGKAGGLALVKASARIAELEAALSSNSRVEEILKALLVSHNNPEDGTRDHLPRILRDFLNVENGKAGRTGFEDGYEEGYAKAHDEISEAIGSTRFMDPPDGGDVSPFEQVRRMRLALESVERTLAKREADCRSYQITMQMMVDEDKDMPLAWKSIMYERRRQIAEEGWSLEHDDQHVNNELAKAAIVYADPRSEGNPFEPDSWPWEPCWYKPGDYRANLVKAGALIFAEIERVDRAQKQGDGRVR